MTRRDRVLHEWAGEAGSLPSALCLHQLFQQQAQRRPTAEAATFLGATIDYASLDASAAALATTLRSDHGVSADTPVALCLDRSHEMLVAILGVLQAGGGYVPMDPKYPFARVASILETCGAGVVVTTEDLVGAESLQGHGGGVQLLAVPGVVVSGAGVSAIGEPAGDAAFALGDLAYILFTSGSTGRPKGVELSHEAVLTCVHHMLRDSALAVDGALRYVQTTTYTFDVSVPEIFVPLCCGGVVALAKPDALLDFDYCEQLIRQQAVTMWGLVPSVLAAFVAHCAVPSCLRHVLPIGEALLPETCRRFFAQREGGTSLWNWYGPTEAAVGATILQVTPALAEQARVGAMPIGTFYEYHTGCVVDAGLRPVGVGVPGELLLGGPCLARGYCNSPDLTDKAFIQWSPDGGRQTVATRQYRTGDLVRWSSNDGVLEFMGRIDFQVKVNGFRIEPGEIEAVAAEAQGVREAVATVREDTPGLKRIVLYATPADADVEAALAACKRKLPHYMVPSAVVTLESWPRTGSGKIDRKALPAPTDGGGEGGEAVFVAAATALEASLADAFQAVLGLQSAVSTSASFFDLGGNSLAAVRLVHALRAADNIGGIPAPLGLADVFGHPTVSALAGRIRALQAESDGGAGAALARPPLVPAPAADLHPLSANQEQMLVLFDLDRTSPVYNMAHVQHFDEQLDASAVRRCLEALVERHPTLRTHVVEDGATGDAMQRVVGMSEYEVVFEVLAVEDGSESGEAFVSRLCDAPFDLYAGPWARFGLLQHGEAGDEGVGSTLVLGMHHIAGDGWSSGVLTRELAALYDAAMEDQALSGAALCAAAGLVPLEVQYVDFAHWQREWLSVVSEGQLAYWRGQLGRGGPGAAGAADGPASSEAADLQRWKRAGGCWTRRWWPAWRGCSGRRARRCTWCCWRPSSCC